MLQSCSEGGFFKTGNPGTERRTIRGFTYVEIRDVFNVTLRHGENTGVVIKCGEALIPGIKTSLSNDTLIISNENHFDWTRKYSRIELIIETDSVEKITLDEPCKMVTDGVFRQDKLIVWATNNLTEIDMEIETGHFYLVNSWINTGNYRLRGSTNYAYLVINGTANLDASELMADDMYLEQKSVDDIHVNVDNYLTYSIMNSGSIFCYNNPANIEESGNSGTGKLIIIDN